MLDPEQHPLAVDVAHLQRRHLPRAQARAAGDRQRCLMLEQVVAVSSRAASSWLSTIGSLRACPVRTSRRARSGRSSACVKKNRNADTMLFMVGRHSQVALLDLEATHLLGRRRVGRPTQECRKPADVANVVALRLAAELTHLHLVDEALAQRADGGGNEGRHGRAPTRGAPMHCLLRATLSRRATRATSPQPRSTQPSRGAGSCYLPKQPFEAHA